jgi:hypothetical protein
MTQRKLFGVGINDCNYNPTPKQTINGKRVSLPVCPYYSLWANMLGRCYSRSKAHTQPTYAGCTVDPQWHTFSVFREWLVSNHFTQGMQLDKDLLIDGNKHYSPTTCVLLPQSINAFLTDKQKPRELPTGIFEASGKYYAQVKDTELNKKVTSHRVDTIEEAVELRNNAKRNNLKYLINKENITDQRIITKLMERYS